MKFYPPIYPGESLFHPGKFPGGDADGAWTAAAFLSFFVRSNTRPEAIPEVSVNVLAVEQQARAARNAWIAGELKSYYASIMHRLGRAAKAA